MPNSNNQFSLTDDQVKEFDNNGVIGPFTLFSPEEAHELWNNKIRLSLLRREDAVYPNSTLNYDRHLDIDEIKSIVTSPEIVKKLSSIMGEDLLCWRTEWFPKYPGDSGTEWHQAKRFFEFENQPKLRPPEDSKEYYVLTVWIALTDTTIENGCMKVMPGSHKEEWFFDESLEHKHEENGNANPDSGFYGYSWENLKVDKNWKPNEEKARSLEMKAGQFIIFTSKCLHGSHPNITTDDTRFAMSARYVTPDVYVYEGMESYTSLSEELPLKNYSTLLVSGKDKFKRNKVTTPELV